LNGTASFLLEAGVGRERLVQSLRQLTDCVEAGAAINKPRSVDYQTLMTVSSLVHDWCWESRYSDPGTGEPRELRLDDGQSGLRGLVTKRFPDRKVDDIVSWMEGNRVIARQPDGSFALTRLSVLIGNFRPPLSAERVATLASQFLETALHNLRTPESVRRNVDRTARVCDLPEKYLPQFREFVREQTQSFLETIDNWLESRSAPTGESTIEAGVHAYLYTTSSKS
jgi:hypothetical protein